MCCSTYYMIIGVGVASISTKLNILCCVQNCFMFEPSLWHSWNVLYCVSKLWSVPNICDLLMSDDLISDILFPYWWFYWIRGSIQILLRGDILIFWDLWSLSYVNYFLLLHNSGVCHFLNLFIFTCHRNIISQYHWTWLV